MRRAAVVPPILVALVALAPACTCGSRASQPASEGDAASPVPVASAPADAARSSAAPARLSAPIAAARAPGGGVFVAGLVVPSKAIAVTRIDAGGATAFTVDALAGVTWSSDATLQLFPAGEGAALLWRGPRDGKVVRQLVIIGRSGEAGAPADVGPAPCATEDGVAWTERGPGGRTRVVLRAWAGGAAREVASVGAEREPVLVCAAHRVFALGQGEEDVTVSAGDGASAGRAAGRAAADARMLIGAADFGEEDEQEHDEFTVGDDLGTVRVGASGTLAVRELRGDALGAWRKLTTNIGDDDVVAVDGDARAVVVVTTREAPGACADAAPGPTTVHALRIDRATGAESSVEIAPADCGKELGPFWTGSAGGRLVIAWTERAPRREPTSAPITGLAYRAFDGAALSPIARVPRPADALVDAGCDKDRCYAVALARAPGTTDMVPEVAQIIAYP